jgi:hypothetical protein
MDFELDKEQRDIQKAVRQFVKAEFDKDYMLDLSQRTGFRLRRFSCGIWGRWLRPV